MRITIKLDCQSDYTRSVNFDNIRRRKEVCANVEIQFLCEEEQRETVTSTFAAHPTAGARHPGRTINFLSVSPISAAIRVVIFSPIRRGHDGEFCGSTGNTQCPP